MKPTVNDIIQLIPAPPNLRVVYRNESENREHCEPVAALALVTVDDFSRPEREVVALAISDSGFEFAESYDNFVRLEWSLRKPCPCSTTLKTP